MPEEHCSEPIVIAQTLCCWHAATATNSSLDTCTAPSPCSITHLAQCTSSMWSDCLALEYSVLQLLLAHARASPHTMSDLMLCQQAAKASAPPAQPKAKPPPPPPPPPALKLLKKAAPTAPPPPNAPAGPQKPGGPPPPPPLPPAKGLKGPKGPPALLRRASMPAFARSAGSEPSTPEVSCLPRPSFTCRPRCGEAHEQLEGCVLLHQLLPMGLMCMGLCC